MKWRSNDELNEEPLLALTETLVTESRRTQPQKKLWPKNARSLTTDSGESALFGEKSFHGCAVCRVELGKMACIATFVQSTLLYSILQRKLCECVVRGREGLPSQSSSEGLASVRVSPTRSTHVVPLKRPSWLAAGRGCSLATERE